MGKKNYDNQFHSFFIKIACKFVYQQYPQSREILARHGRLKGLVKFCPFFILSLNQTLFNQSLDS